MDILVFYSSGKEYNINLSHVNDNVIQLNTMIGGEVPTEEELESGFWLKNEYNGKNMSGDFYDSFNTIYRTEPEYIQLSNDGSQYVPPTPPVPPPPYVPTIEEVRQQKINELSMICNQTIITGVTLHDLQYSYTEEDQANIKELFDLVLQTQLPQFYHANGESCREYSVEEIIELYVAESLNKMSNITYFNQMRMYINTLEDKEVISAIQYGDPLTGEYLENYENAMQALQDGIDALLGNGNE